MRVSILLLAGAAAVHAQPSLLSRSTVYEPPSRDPYDLQNRTGFNHAPNVALLPDGRLLCVWFSGPYEASVHQAILAAYSEDEGRTWSPADVFHDFPRRSDFDPALLVDGQRTWAFFSAGRWTRYPFVSDEKENVGERSFQIYFKTSDDSGRTWSPAHEAPTGRGFNCRNNGIRLRSGPLVLPVTRLRGNHAGLLVSPDRGKSWRMAGGVVTTPMGEDEPAVVELNSGAVLMVLRTSGGRLWRTKSSDLGETWSAPEQTALEAPASSHSLFRLRDGRIALTHNASPKVRTPLTMRLSEDDGESWGPPLELASAPAWKPGSRESRRQVSYPSVAQLPDGALVVVWADIGISDTEQYGIIQSARVKP
jgi:hypothetical protein